VARRVPIEPDSPKPSGEEPPEKPSEGKTEEAQASPPSPPTPEGAPEEGEQPIEERYLRLAAEFENYKKRIERERATTVAYANEDLLEKLLPVVDNLERALTAAKPADAHDDGIVAGVELTLREFKDLLARKGVEPLDATGERFDPTIHEAVSTQPSTEVPEGGVITQIEIGYRYKERILRPAKVVVSSGPPS
jgi:molecular chaperone GrpE